MIFLLRHSSGTVWSRDSVTFGLDLTETVVLGGGRPESRTNLTSLVGKWTRRIILYSLTKDTFLLLLKSKILRKYVFQSLSNIFNVLSLFILLYWFFVLSIPFYVVFKSLYLL